MCVAKEGTARAPPRFPSSLFLSSHPPPSTHLVVLVDLRVLHHLVLCCLVYAKKGRGQTRASRGGGVVRVRGGGRARRESRVVARRSEEWPKQKSSARGLQDGGRLYVRRVRGLLACPIGYVQLGKVGWLEGGCTGRTRADEKKKNTFCVCVCCS